VCRFGLARVAPSLGRSRKSRAVACTRSNASQLHRNVVYLRGHGCRLVDVWLSVTVVVLSWRDLSLKDVKFNPHEKGLAVDASLSANGSAVSTNSNPNQFSPGQCAGCQVCQFERKHNASEHLSVTTKTTNDAFRSY
jgi:hypothetical protein